MKKLQIAALLVCAVAMAHAQAVNASLLGTITDSTGGVVAGAKVTITETKPDKKPPEEQTFTLLFGKETEDKSSVYAKLDNGNTIFMLR